MIKRNNLTAKERKQIIRRDLLNIFYFLMGFISASIIWYALSHMFCVGTFAF